MEKFAEDDRIDQFNAQRRRQKQIEHRHEVERLIAEKRAMYEALVQKEAEDEAARCGRHTDPYKNLKYSTIIIIIIILFPYIFSTISSL